MDTNMDFVGKGQASGEVAQSILAQGRVDPGTLRPWVGKDGKRWCGDTLELLAG